ncbi:MAG: PAS domain S-box protein [Holophagales bacterium]|nr:PAS domain S-box protein [Holophagales bacterium]
MLVYAMKVGPLLLASLVLLGPTETALSATADAASGKRVLVLHSYYKGYKWTDDENRGISAALEPALGVENVFVEYMDTKRFFEERFVSQLPEAYRRKYLDHRIDLIVATDDRALEFLVEHRDEVFPGTPVVFCGVNYFQEGKLKGRPLFTGVSEDVDLGASLDTALALHPGTRRIYVVNEDTETGRAVRTRLAEIGPSWKGVPLEPLDGLPMEKLLARLRSLPASSLVFFTFYSRDAEGKVFGYDESIRLVSQASNVPVYGAWDFNLGFGLVGGMLASGFDQGETAGRIALRVLRGERPASIPVVKNLPGRYLFDHLQLVRWGIPSSRLPAGSSIVNLPESAYARYRNLILIGAGALILLGVLNAFLALNISRRKMAEEALRNHQEHLEETIRVRSAQLSTANEELRRDIVERERTERALRTAERNLRSIFENAAEGIYQSTLSGRFVTVNPALARMAGYDSPAAMVDAIADIRKDFYVEPGTRARFEESLASEAEVRGFESLVKRKDGELIWVLENARAIRDEKGRVDHYEGIVQDVSDRRRLAEKLDRTRQKLRGLAAEITRVEERERRTIATQLHDQLGAVLSMAKVKLASLRQGAEGTPIAPALEEVHVLVGNAVQETRSLTWELSPPILYQLGLPAALEWLGENVEQRHGIAFRLTKEGEARELGEERRFLVFSAVRELLLNVVKHADASGVSLRLRWLVEGLEATLLDDGKGFDVPGAAALPDATRSFGLFSIQERFDDLGGSVSIRSTPGEGTSVTLVLPYAAEAGRQGE